MQSNLAAVQTLLLLHDFLGALSKRGFAVYHPRISNSVNLEVRYNPPLSAKPKKKDTFKNQEKQLFTVDELMMYLVGPDKYCELSRLVYLDVSQALGREKS